MQWIAPRKRGSGWSRRNKEHVAQLEAVGLLLPAGIAKIEAAKADGSWNALDAVENLELPPDLVEALAEHTDAPHAHHDRPRAQSCGYRRRSPGERRYSKRIRPGPPRG